MKCKKRCSVHYRRWLKSGVDGPPGRLRTPQTGECGDKSCADPAAVKGLCKRHYQSLAESRRGRGSGAPDRRRLPPPELTTGFEPRDPDLITWSRRRKRADPRLAGFTPDGMGGFVRTDAKTSS